ncbi:guanylate cyclase 32E isoform X2 [Atheta coriaria]
MWILVQLITLTPLIAPSVCKVFTMGYLTGSQRLPDDKEYQRHGLTISGAISLAVEEVNAGELGRRGHKLEFIIAETYGKEKISVAQTAELWRKNVSVYIGPQEYCEHEAYMAASFNLPMISYFCTVNETSDKSKYPTFARTRPPITQISKSVASVLTYFNWTSVVLLYLNSPNPSDFEYGNIARVIPQYLSAAGVNVVASRSWSQSYMHVNGYNMENPFHQLVEETYKDTRIYVILGHHYEHLEFMVAMEKRKLFEKGEYFVVGVDIDEYNEKNPATYLQGFLTEEADPSAQQAFRHYLGVVPSSPVGFENFTVQVNTYLEKPPFNFSNPLNHLNVTAGKIIVSGAAYLYDAVHLYARALMQILDEGGDTRNGSAIINCIKGTHYKSAMGYMVYMDENGDAEGNYTLIARKRLHVEADKGETGGGVGGGNSGGTANAGYGLYPVGVFALRSKDSKLPFLQLNDKIDWMNGKPPIAVPPCGFRGEKCISYTLEIIYGVAGGMLLVVAVIGLIFYRNWRYEQELDSLLWKVDFRDIQINGEPNANGLGPKVTRALHPLRTSQGSINSNADFDFRYSSIFTQIGIYKVRVFAIKRIHKKSIDITREMKKELKMMRDLRHDNLNAFIGACTEPPNICIVTEYCTRGSLKDILENEDVKLDSMFIASLVGDILRGMIYLHDSPVRFHGALHTANCLVDSRWVVKLADFGLREFKRGAEDHSLKDSSRILEKCRTLLYRAPELLRETDSYISKDPPLGTQKGDVYSFGIILYELHSRHGPFGETPLSAAEILNRVIHCPPGCPPFRPPLESLEHSFDYVLDCLKECWHESPDERPDFKSIRTKLRPLRKGMKPNIFDNMMAMMEKYANNLEALVDERTDQLQEEKKKTEALLYEMLPRPVAEQLKRGNKVEAEGFDCVTIYFSDIVGFTRMSAESTPLQVVDFLNDLYTCFDSIIENYDVYKVETIGDAYMVVSGLPIRNDDQHAAEIATMSLHLLSEVKNFTIRHRTGEKLMLRIGIHSGPVCAGVVGLKMPRYCLFGDTVNTASRMESTGESLKIHCSKQCQHLLSKLGGYNLIERGMVSMKGKGDLQTYFLIGEDERMRLLRKEARERRRDRSHGRCKLLDNNGHIVPRSSLKNKNSIVRSPIPRCSSFESPKRLRFASDENLESGPTRSRSNKHFEDIDASPLNAADGNVDNCSEAWRTSSTSCPCIENLANSSATLAQFQLSMFDVSGRKGSRKNSKNFGKHSNSIGQSVSMANGGSVPSLRHCLSVPRFHAIQTISAPTSPRRKDHFELSKFPECEDVCPWVDSTPLLKVTTHNN